MPQKVKRAKTTCEKQYIFRIGGSRGISHSGLWLLPWYCTTAQHYEAWHNAVEWVFRISHVQQTLHVWHYALRGWDYTRPRK
jgi:hypothetical protein